MSSQQISIRVNPEYYKLVPRPTSEEYRVLKESITEHGQREPIIVNGDGYILDGYTRYDILHERGITPQYTVKHFDSKEEEELYVINANLARRHLNAYQKVRLVYSLYKIKRTGSGGDNRNKPRTGGAASIVGRTIGVNRNTVSMAAWLIENAPARTRKQLENGNISIANAYKILRKHSTPHKTGIKQIREDTVLQCPHCKHSLKRKDLLIVKTGGRF